MKKYLLTMLAVLVGSNMWAQSFSYTESNKTLTIGVTTDLSNDKDAAGKVQTEVANRKPETVIVNGGGKINSDFIKAILYGKDPSGSKVYAVANKDTKTLDLGNVVLVDWTTNTFCGSWGHIDKDITITTLTLPKTPDNIIPDYPFIGKDSWGNFWPIEQIIIPDGCVKIGAYFAKNMSTLEMVKWPDSVKEIGDMAFANLTKWNIPALPKNLEIIGNSAFALTSSWVTCKTIMFPSSVKIICPGAFLMRQYQEVYFQSKTAPLLPLGESLIQPSYGNMTAFGAETLMGNNGFTDGSLSNYADKFGEGKANRENYVASSGAYFAILHFPKGLTDDEKATYTDINKKYETWNGTDGKFNKDATKVVGQETSTLKYGDYTVNNQVNPGYKDTYVGEDYIWPSQSQWMRSFLTATNGVCWDGVTPYTSDLSAEQIALLRKVGYSEYTDEALKQIAHVGTRQFVLTADDATETPDFPLPITEGGRWWTLCVPFNMTKKMVDKAMGVGTQVCRFSSVTRKLDTDGRGRGDGNKGNHIYLEFRHDVYKHKFERNTTDGTFHDAEWSESLPACGDDDIVIYAHEAYMVKPTKTDKNPTFVVDDYEPVPGSPLPTIIKATETRYTNNTKSHAVDDNAGEYRFIGNYYINTAQRTAVSVPVNCYFYGLAKASDTKPAFWFWPYDSHLTWPSYKCTIETVNVELGKDDADKFFNFTAGFSASSKYQSSFFGDDELNSNETTSVDQVVIVAGNDDQAIYNLSGQLVSKNGNLDGLQKGVYVKGGKKFIVK